jgi:hypothetical protein
MRVEGATLHLDVGELATEARQAVTRWIASLERSPASSDARNVAKHFSSLIHVRRVVVTSPVPSGGILISVVSRTN